VSAKGTTAKQAEDALDTYVEAWREEQRVTEQLFEARRAMKDAAKALLRVVPEGRYYVRSYATAKGVDLLVQIPLWDEDEPPPITVTVLDNLEQRVQAQADLDVAQKGGASC
jgi:hypothetical protein